MLLSGRIVGRTFLGSWTRNFHRSPVVLAKTKTPSPFPVRNTLPSTRSEPKKKEEEDPSKLRLNELKQFVNALPQLSDLHMTQTLQDLIKSNNVKYLVPFFRYFREKSPEEITPEMLVIIIDGLNRSKEHATLDLFIRELTDTYSDYPFNLASQREILKYFVENQRFENLKNFLGDLKGKGPGEEAVWAEALRICAHFGEDSEVETLYNSLLSLSPNLHPSVHHSLLLGYSQSYDLHRLITAFEKMKSQRDFVPDIKSYNIVLDALSRSGEVDQVENYFQELRGSNTLEPDQLTYCSLVRCYSKHNQDEKLEDAIRHLKSQKSVNIKSWNTILAARKERGDLRGFLEAYLEIRRMEVRPDHMTSHLFEKMITDLPLAKVLAEIDSLSSAQVSAGEEDPISTLQTGLIQGLSGLKSPREHLERFVEVSKSRGVCLKGAAQNALLVGLVNSGALHKLLSVFEDGPADVIGYAVVIGALGKNKRLDEMVRVLRRLVADPTVSQEHRSLLSRQLAELFREKLPS